MLLPHTTLLIKSSVRVQVAAFSLPRKVPGHYLETDCTSVHRPDKKAPLFRKLLLSSPGPLFLRVPKSERNDLQPLTVLSSHQGCGLDEVHFLQGVKC